MVLIGDLKSMKDRIEEDFLIKAITKDTQCYADAYADEFLDAVLYDKGENRYIVHAASRTIWSKVQNEWVLLKSCVDSASLVLEFLTLCGDYSNPATRNIITNLYAAEQLKSTVRKKNVDLVAPDASSKAKSLFLEMNAHCGKFNTKQSMNTGLFVLCLRASHYIRQWICEPSVTDSGSRVYGVGDGRLRFGDVEIDAAGRFGPGASIGTRKTAYIEKLSAGVLTCTSPYLYRRYLNTTYTSPTCYDIERNRLAQYGWQRVEGNKITTVSKSREIDRCIATEPSLNMFFQLGLGEMLESCLRESTGLDNRVQPERNKVLAREGSLNGKYATIDLRSASDTISLLICQLLLPPSLMAYIEEFRSPYASIDSTTVKLNMVSTMGNGFTFPLQTMIFTALVLAVYDHLGIKIAKPKKFSTVEDLTVAQCGNFGVFGDDIVVDVKAFPLLCDLLQECGFLVNTSKSFADGPFRESCGGDYLLGSNVRGFYIESLNGLNNLNALLNKIVYWSAAHFPLVHTAKYVRENMSTFLPVPPIEDITAGVHVPMALRIRVKAKDRSGQQRIPYRRWVGVRHRKSVKQFSFRAVMKAILHGSVVDGHYHPRRDDEFVAFRQQTVFTSNWEYRPSRESLLFDSTPLAWETMATLLLTGG